MLGKLFKHEMKATSRLLLPLLLILVVLTLMDCIVLNLHIFKGSLLVIPGFITFAYALSLIAMAIVSAVIIIIRFYKNLMTDEGYLMFTLPVKSHDLINSKLAAAIIWNVISITAIIGSLFTVLYTTKHAHLFKVIYNSIVNELRAQFGPYTTMLGIETIILFIISLFSSILMIYVSIAIGHLINGHKVIGSFAAYIGIYTAGQIVSMVGLLIFSLIYKSDINDVLLLPKLIFPIIILYSIALTVVYYVVTNYIFRKKLNLD